MNTAETTEEMLIYSREFYDLLRSVTDLTAISFYLLRWDMELLFTVPSDLTLPDEIRHELTHLPHTRRGYTMNETNYSAAVTPIISDTQLIGVLIARMPPAAPEQIHSLRVLTQMISDAIAARGLLRVKTDVYPEMFHNVLYDHLDEDLSTKRICEILNTSRSALYEKFQKYTGKTIGGFVRDLRMEKARDLLSNTNLSIKDIARITGFHDYNYFCRVFKKTQGISAASYRKLHTLSSLQGTKA